MVLGHARISTTADVYWHLANTEAFEEALKYSPSKSIRPPEKENVKATTRERLHNGSE